MPNENNVFISERTTSEQIKTYEQEKNNNYFEEKRRFSEQHDALQQNKRTTLGFTHKDSKEMTDVKNSLNQLYLFFSSTMPADPKQFELSRTKGHQLYQTLIQHCQTYITAKGRPITDSGKARLDMVKNLYYQCREEEKLFDDCAQSLYAAGGNESIYWSNILGEIRTAHINADTLEVRKVGRDTKPIWKLRQKDKSVFFREETKTISDDKNLFLEQYKNKMYDECGMGDVQFQEFLRVYDEVKKNPDILEKANHLKKVFLDSRQEKEQQLRTMEKENPDYEIVSEQLRSLEHILDIFNRRSDDFQYVFDWKPMNDFMMKIRRDILPKERLAENHPLSEIGFLTAYMRVSAFVREQSSIVKRYTKVGIREGSSLSVRNVAASRLAGLLGNSDLFVKSRNVSVERNGENKQGVLMAEASGESFAELKKRAHREKLRIEHTPEAIRQLINLQLMDTLIACEDRGNEDLFVESQMEKGRLIIKKVVAVNSEYSFGEHSYDEITDGEKITEIPFINDDGESYLPAIDSQFYEHIMNLSPEHIDYTLGDLLTDRELSALKDRLTRMQEVLKESKEFEPDFLIKEEDWERMVHKFDSLDTYISNFSK